MAELKPLNNKRRFLHFGLGAGLVLVALLALLAPTLFYRLPTTDLYVARKTVSLDIASTEAAREKGLGGRDTMPVDKGMLFVLDKPFKQCLWMKDMKFSLDMVWLSSAKQVVYTRQNVSPKTYPEKFCPNQDAKYIIELNAGQVRKLSIHANQTLTFR